MGASPRDETVHHRLRQGRRRRIVMGMVLSVALHAVLFFALPVIPSSRHRAPTPELEVVRLPDAVSDPPPRVVIPEPGVPVPRPPPPRPDTPRRGEPPSIPPPQVIPHDVPPRLLNRREVERALLNLYPASFEVMEVGGAVTLWLYVDTDGQVVRTVLREPSQFEAFNRAAVTVARAMRFRPAEQAGEPVSVWVQQRILFQTRDSTGMTPGRETGGDDGTD